MCRACDVGDDEPVEVVVHGASEDLAWFSAPPFSPETLDQRLTQCRLTPLSQETSLLERLWAWDGGLADIDFGGDSATS